MASLAKRIQQLEQAFSKQDEKDIEFHDDGSFTLFLSDGSQKRYKPTPTGLAVQSSDAFFNLLVGPFGSGKTTICINDLIKRAANMPLFEGKRKSRYLCIRNTRPDLISTTYFTWQQWFARFGRVHSLKHPILTSRHTFNDGEGEIEIEVIFLALDSEDDLKKLDSLEVTGAYVNEIRHLPEGLVSRLSGRVGRYPPMDECSFPYKPFIIADTNPPSTRHWIYKKFEEDRPASYRLFKQPPGLIKDEKGHWQENPKHDTAAYLPKTYYSQMADGATEEFIKVYALGDWGSAMDGKPVYADYNDDIHSVDVLHPIKNLPIDFGFDFGLTPAGIVTQLTPNGQLLVLKEFVAQDMGIRRLGEDVILPYLKQYFANFQIRMSVGDPAGNQRAQTDEKTCIQILNEFGFKAKGAATNSIVKRIDSINYFLNKLIDRKGGLLISRKECPVTRTGFLGGYHYRRIRMMSDISNVRYTDEPEKNEYSHVHDALQYIALTLRPNLNSHLSNEAYLNSFIGTARGL